MVVNLAAGLDSRPYRLNLPKELQWVEVDLPEIVDPKREILGDEKPRCRLDVIPQHLGDEKKRRELFSQLNRRSQNTLVLSEGLLIYLDDNRVTSLAADLHAQPNFKYWMVEVTSPKVLEYIIKKWGHHLKAADAPMAFAPADWRKFFADRGWEVVQFENMALTARRMNREPGLMKFFGLIARMFPNWGEQQRKLWEGGVALLRRL
jgi:methyltransferase (TIGR00027 family)